MLFASTLRPPPSDAATTATAPVIQKRCGTLLVLFMPCIS